jgi:glycosyltransferase involved in cell wall biosynthesis
LGKNHVVSLDTLYTSELDAVFDKDPRPDVSVVVPIFNQQQLLRHNLSQLANCMRMNWELILIDDSSTDNSLKVVMEWAQDAREDSALLLRLRVLRTKRQQFETICDAIGFSLATAPHVLEVQSDMELTEPGFDYKLVSAMNSQLDIFMISGRGCHPFKETAEGVRLTIEKTNNRFLFLNLILAEFISFAHSLTGFFHSGRADWIGKHPRITQNSQQSQGLNQILPDASVFSIEGRAGRLGSLISEEIDVGDLSTGQIWVGQTVMRGPLLIKRDRLESLGSLDTRAFFLGNDDHDLAYRAFFTNGYRTGFVPVGFKSPIHHGSTRKTRSLSTLVHLARSMRRTAKHLPRSGLYSLIELGENAPLPSNEIRSFSFDLKGLFD